MSHTDAERRLRQNLKYNCCTMGISGSVSILLMFPNLIIPERVPMVSPVSFTEEQSTASF